MATASRPVYPCSEPEMETLEFKFRFVREGQVSGLRSTKARATDRELHLGAETVRYADVVDTSTRDNRVVFVLSERAELGPKTHKSLQDGQALVLEIYGKKARTVERFVDKAASSAQAESHQRALEATGKGHLFNTIRCPHCEATVDLSELDKSQYSYCRFCESVVQESQVATSGERYRHCDECHLFDRVRGYTEFYFYFLLVVYGVSYKRRHLCDNCVGRLFWKVLAVNFIFLLGVPSALWMKLRSMQGRDPSLAQLAKANRLVRQGKMPQAEPLFVELQQRFPEHPGLLYNEARGHLNAGDGERAAHCLDRSLRACSNYEPTVHLVQALQARDS